jgi:hypothetical protein
MTFFEQLRVAWWPYPERPKGIARRVLFLAFDDWIL